MPAAPRPPLVDLHFGSATVRRQVLDIVALEAWHQGLLSAFPGGLKQYGHGRCGYSIAFLCPGVGAAARAALARGVKNAIAAHGFAYQVADSGVGIDVTAAAVNKGAALEHFSAQVGCSIASIAKFGDKGGEHGNDRTLLQPPLAFCVGVVSPDDRCADGVAVTPESGPNGVLKALADVPVDAPLACDFDGTLALYPAPMPDPIEDALLDRLQVGTPVAIMTGRHATSVCEAVVEPLRQRLERREQAPSLLDHLVCYCYNGAYAQTGTDLVQEIARLEIADQLLAYALPNTNPFAQLARSAPNDFGVRLADASALRPPEVARLADWTLRHGNNKYSLLVPGDSDVPAGFRSVCRGQDIIIRTVGRNKQPIDATHLEAAREMQVWPAEARLVVPQTSLIPEVFEGRKAAGHVTLTVQTKVSLEMKKLLVTRQGAPMAHDEFLALVNDHGGKGTKDVDIDLLICGETGNTATSEAYANTYADFGGSANVKPSGEFESSREILRRELKEEAGAAAQDLLGDLRAQQREQITSVDLGGLFCVSVKDSYTKAVSQRALSLAQFTQVLARTAADGHEIKALAIVCMPPIDQLPQPLAQDAKEATQMLTEHLKSNWCALPGTALGGDEATQRAARRGQEGVVRMIVKALTARGHFGQPYSTIS